MALIKSFTGNDTKTGTTHLNSYIRIGKVEIDTLGRAKITVDFWESKAWFECGQKIPWRSITCVMENFDHSGANPKTQLYNWLKTSVPELVGATDELT